MCQLKSKTVEQPIRQANLDALRELPTEVTGINWELYEKIKKAKAKKLQPK